MRVKTAIVCLISSTISANQIGRPVDHALVKQYFIEMYNDALGKAMNDQGVGMGNNRRGFFDDMGQDFESAFGQEEGSSKKPGPEVAKYSPPIGNAPQPFESNRVNRQPARNSVQIQPHSYESFGGHKHKHHHHKHSHEHSSEHKHAHEHLQEHSHEHKHTGKHQHVHKHEHHHEHNHHHKHKEAHEHSQEHKHAHKHAHQHKGSGSWRRSGESEYVEDETRNVYNNAQEGTGSAYAGAQDDPRNMYSTSEAETRDAYSNTKAPASYTQRGQKNYQYQPEQYQEIEYDFV